MTCCATSQIHSRRPQRIIWRRHQHLVAIIQQTLHRHHDKLRDTITDDDVVYCHAINILLLGVMHNGFARGKQPFGICVARRLIHIANHILQDFLRRFKTEWRRIANIQLDDTMTILFHLFGARQYWPTNVVAHIIKLGRFE